MEAAPSLPAKNLASWIQRFFDDDWFTTPVTSRLLETFTRGECPRSTSPRRKLEEEKKDKQYHRVESQYGTLEPVLSEPLAPRLPGARPW